jgi:hypothetical protein
MMQETPPHRCFALAKGEGENRRLVTSANPSGSRKPLGNLARIGRLKLLTNR